MKISDSIVPLLISNLLPAYNPTNLPSSALLYLCLSFRHNSTLIMQEFLLSNLLGEGKYRSLSTRENPLSTEHAPTYLTEIQIE